MQQIQQFYQMKRIMQGKNNVGLDQIYPSLIILAYDITNLLMNL